MPRWSLTPPPSRPPPPAALGGPGPGGVRRPAGAGVDRDDPRVAVGRRAGRGQDGVQAPEEAPEQEHLADLRGQREGRQVPPELRQRLALGRQRSDGPEKVHGVLHGLRRGRLHGLREERRNAVGAAALLLHDFDLQADLLQRGPLQLGELKLVQALAAGAAVEVEAHARAAAPRAPLALLRARLGDPGRLQRGNSRVRVVALLLVPARVDDVDDVVDGHRRLGDVGRQDDLHHARARALEHLALLRGGHHRVQREHTEAGGIREGRGGLQEVLQAADLVPAREEDQRGPRADLALAPLRRRSVRALKRHVPQDARDQVQVHFLGVGRHLVPAELLGGPRRALDVREGLRTLQEGLRHGEVAEARRPIHGAPPVPAPKLRVRPVGHEDAHLGRPPLPRRHHQGGRPRLPVPRVHQRRGGTAGGGRRRGPGGRRAGELQEARESGVGALQERLHDGLLHLRRGLHGPPRGGRRRRRCGVHLRHDVVQVELLDGVHEARDLHDGAAAEVLREEAHLHRGGHQHHPQPGVGRQKVPQDDEQEVGELVALVDLVHDEMGGARHGAPAPPRGRQAPRLGELAQEHPVGAEHHARLGAPAALEPDAVAH